MKVLFLSQIVPYPPHGGVLQRGYNIVRQAGSKAELHLLAFVHPDVLKSEQAIDESRSVLSRFCASIEYFPLWAKHSPLAKSAALGMSLFSRQPFSVIAHRSETFGRYVREHLRSTRFDVVHADTLALAQFVDPRGPTPSLLTHHNIESMLMARRADVETRLPAKWFLERETAKLESAERALAPLFDINVVMSHLDGHTLQQRVPGVRTAVVPNGVDTEYFEGLSVDDGPVLIYTGGMNMFANRDAVLFFLRDVWPAVKARVPGVRFFAVGQDPPAELQAIADDDGQVTVTGYVDDIRPYVRKASVYIVPLRVGGGTRLKVLDAMAMGKAMVSTSIGCEGITLTPGEHLLVADDAAGFAEQTVALLTDPVRRRVLGQAARRQVETLYAWPVVGTQLFDAYREARAVRAHAR